MPDKVFWLMNYCHTKIILVGVFCKSWLKKSIKVILFSQILTVKQRMHFCFDEGLPEALLMGLCGYTRQKKVREHSYTAYTFPFS